MKVMLRSGKHIKKKDFQDAGLNEEGE